MSNLRQTNGDDYPEAAEKNMQDAMELLKASRYDGAGYIAGYSVECVLKTIVQVEGGTAVTVRGHNLNDLSRQALLFASLPTAKTARYVSLPAITTLSYGLPQGWQETLRYRPMGTIPIAAAKAWVEEAERLYHNTIGSMKLDGVITS